MASLERIYLMLNNSALIVELLFTILIMQIFIGAWLLWAIDNVQKKTERINQRMKNYFGGGE
jgi:hypothetical protein